MTTEENYMAVTVKEAAELWKYQEKRQIEANYNIIERQAQSDCKIREREIIANNDTENKIRLEKAHSDIAAKREMQQRCVSVNQNGEIQVSQKLFGSEIRGALNVKLKECRKMVPRNGSPGEAILQADFVRPNGEMTTVSFDLSRDNEKRIITRFHMAGITFGVREKQDRELLIKLFAIISDTKNIFAIPMRHGWNMDNNGDFPFFYVYPEEDVWEDFESNV